MVIPEFKNTFNTFAKSVPQYIEKIEGWITQLVNFFEVHGITLPELSFDAKKIMDVLSSAINDSGIVDKMLNITGSIVSGIVNLVVAFAFSFYLLAQKEKLSESSQECLYAFFKESKVNRFLSIVELADQTFTNSVTGQLLEAVIIGVLCFIGMLISECHMQR